MDGLIVAGGLGLPSPAHRAAGTDIFYYDRDTGRQVAVTNQNGKQQLSDVSGNLIGILHGSLQEGHA